MDDIDNDGSFLEVSYVQLIAIKPVSTRRGEGEEPRRKCKRKRWKNHQAFINIIRNSKNCTFDNRVHMIFCLRIGCLSSISHLPIWSSKEYQLLWMLQKQRPTKIVYNRIIVGTGLFQLVQDF